MPKSTQRPRILLVDIETAPTLAYIWDLNTHYVPHSQVAETGYTICWAAKWLGEKEIMYRSIFHDGEEAMVDDIYDLLEEADIVVHFNGDKFDLPKLNTEFLLWQMSPPAPCQSIDVYKTVRKRFKLLSNSMAYVAKILGIEQKIAHKGMDLWTECRDMDPDAWEEMKEYNIQDVVVLEEMYEVIKAWIQPHPNVTLYDDRDDLRCPTCGSDHFQSRGKARTATMVYDRFQCMADGCGKWFRARVNNLSPSKRRKVTVGVA
jgi:DNA polymerase elongation subunit (family B)